MSKKFISVFLTVFLIISSFSVFDFRVNAETEGTCGDDLFWKFDESALKLIIYGNGEMMNFNSPTKWDGNNTKITSIVIEDGVTTIGKNAFSICEFTQSISIPISVKKINEKAFEYCNSLKNIYYLGSQAQWNEIEIVSIGNDILKHAKIHYNGQQHVCSYGEWKIINEPTCLNDGKKYRTCSCGNEEFEIISATRIHDFKWETKLEATCITNGEEIQQCSVCGMVGERRTINKFGHKAGEWETINPSTCFSEGLKIKKCIVCGEKMELESIAKLDHTFGSWSTVIKATETSDGEEVRTCKICKTTEKRKIDKLQGSDILLGDANGDGKIKATDARLVLQVVAGIKENKDVNFSNADVNENGKITAVDARIILQFVASET